MWIAQREEKWAARPIAAASWCVFDAAERQAAAGVGPGGRSKSFVEKGADGYCVNLDRATHFCRIWETRPNVCRSYDCNGDFLLQVAVRSQFANIADLVKLAATAYIPKETYIRVPPVGEG